MAATTEEVPRPYGRGTSSVVSFVVAMNRVDVVDLVVDLVDVGLDIDLVDVDLDVDLVDVGPVDVVPAVNSRVAVGVGDGVGVGGEVRIVRTRAFKGTLASSCIFCHASVARVLCPLRRVPLTEILLYSIHSIS